MRYLLMVMLLTACSSTSIQNAAAISRALFGYIPPPEQTTVLQALTREYDRCLAINPQAQDCAQRAYTVIRKDKGLDDAPLPRGIVIVREDDETVIRQDAEK